MTVSKRSSSVKGRFNLCWRSESRRRLFSATMMAPSAINPKSNAPRLMRLALILPRYMPIARHNMVTGITVAVTKAARKSPSIKNKTKITSAAPSKRFLATVLIVASTNKARLRIVRTSMSLGKVLVTRFIFYLPPLKQRGYWPRSA